MSGYAAARRLRIGRYSAAGQIYMVTSVVRDRQPVFQDFHLARRLVHELRLCEEQQWARSLAWVIMPDHFHWLFELRHRSLPWLMQKVKSRSALAILKDLPGQHALWQPGYHDRAIRSEDDLRPLARYVIANPIRAGLVRRVGDYPLWDAVWI